MRIDIRDIKWNIFDNQILNGASLSVSEGSFVGLLGPNGSGKTSLLRTIYRFVSPDSGVIEIAGSDLFRMKSKEVAKLIAVVAQEKPTDFEFTVEEIVIMGRLPHKMMFEGESKEDKEIVYKALVRVGMEDFYGRSFNTLSGGEKQRVLIARALAQQPQVLILDEPTNHLDIRYQLEILNLVKSLKKTTITVLHDLNLAARYCDYVYLMQGGKIVKQGEPINVLTPENLGEVYGVVADVTQDNNSNYINIAFRGICS